MGIWIWEGGTCWNVIHDPVDSYTCFREPLRIIFIFHFNFLNVHSENFVCFTRIVPVSDSSHWSSLLPESALHSIKLHSIFYVTITWLQLPAGLHVWSA